MGSVVGTLFGGGQKYEAPAPVQYDPVPVREAEAEPESLAVRDAERRRLQARRGMSGALLTSPLGAGGASGSLGSSGGSGASGLLGRTM